MVKLFGPAMSIDATGTVADAMTFSKWKGRHYLRKASKPANPQTGLQVGIRAMFKFLVQNWSLRSPAEQATWETPAADTQISPFNAYLAENVRRWKRFQPPGQQNPIGNTGTVGLLPGAWPLATGKVRSILLTTGYRTVNDNWGMLMFRGSTGFSTSLDNCIAAIMANDEVTDFLFLDDHLDPGTYYYNFRSFTTDGAIGPQTGERNATATA